MTSRRLLHACAMPIALVLVAGLARAQAPQQQQPQDAPPEPALEQPTDEPIDLSTPEPEDIKGARPFVERPVASPWDSTVGVDYRKPSIPATNFQPDQLTAGAIPDQSTGVAWATITAPGLGSALGWDQTAIETRVDPSSEQGQFGTRLSRSVPVGEDLSVTLENGVSVTRSLPSGGAQGHGWASSQALRFNVLPTDTTVSIGADISSTDEKWLRTLSAEQKLFGGPFSVTGSVAKRRPAICPRVCGPDSSGRGDYLPQFLTATGQRTQAAPSPIRGRASYRARGDDVLDIGKIRSTKFTICARASGVLGPPSGLERRP